MSAMKTQENDASVEAFLDSVSDGEKRRDCRALVALMEEATGAPPKMWGANIVGFGKYHYKYASGREGDWFAAGFSPRKQNLTGYIIAGFDDYAPLLRKLGPHSTGVSCLYLKRLADIDVDVLRTLVEQSVADVMADDAG